MGGGGHDVRVWNWRRMRPARHESGEVRHVDQEKSTDLVSDVAHADEIDNPGIGASPADDQFRAFLLSQLLQFVVVNRLRLFGHAVRDDLVSLAGKVQMMAVRQMSAVREIES